MENAIDAIIRRRNPNHDLIRRIILHDIFPNPLVDQGNMEVPQFDLNDMEEKYAKLYFRFNKEDIPRLQRALQIPDNIRTRSGYISTGMSFAVLQLQICI